MLKHKKNREPKKETEANQRNLNQMASKNLIAIWVCWEMGSAHDNEKQIRRKKMNIYT